MKRPTLRASLLGYVVVATTLAGNSLIACSSTQNSAGSQSQATPVANDASSGGMMDHSQMGHNMDLGPADAEYNLRFLDAMVPHHEGAVVMAKEVLQKSQRPEMKKFAEEIIKAQTKEIAEMKQWRTAWYLKAPQTPMAWHASMGHMMAMSEAQRKSMMMSMDLGAADAEFDLRFLNAMIPHHEGAIVMAKDALNKSKRPEIKQLATAIMTSQQAEINQMKQWRTAWYNQ